MSAASAREALMAKIPASGDPKARFFESALFRNLMREFLRNIGAILSRRLERNIAFMHTADTSQIVDGENLIVLLFRVYQSNIEIALPFECINDFLCGLLGRSYVPNFSALTKEDLETLGQFISRSLVEEEYFARHRVLLKGMSSWAEEDRLERLKHSEEIHLALQTSSVTYLLRAYCDYGFISRLRTYGQLCSGALVRDLGIQTHWKLRASCALNSYQLLLSIVPGERIPLRELCSDEFHLVQEASGLSKCSVPLKGDVQFSKRKEVV